MTFKEFKMADISIGHIERNDVDLLESTETWNFPFMVSQYEEGFFICLASVQIEYLNRDCAKFSSAFQHILRLAKEAGFDFINFDRDGEEYEGQPKFDW